MGIVGWGDRNAKVGFVEIGVYRVSFYVDTAGAAHFLNDFKGKGHGDLVKDDAFYSELMKAKFRKTFHLRFVRSLGKQKLQDGFWKSLRDYLAPEDCADGQQLIWAIPDVKEHDVLTLRFAHDGETAEIAHNGEPPHLVVVNPNVWLAVQRIYFDAKTEYPAIRTGAITSLPDALLTAAPYEPPPVAAVHRASMSVESDFLDCDSFIGDLGTSAELGCEAGQAESPPSTGATSRVQQRSCCCCFGYFLRKIGRAGPDDVQLAQMRGGHDNAALPLVGQVAGVPKTAADMTELHPQSREPSRVPGGFELRVEVVKAEHLKKPEYRFGDLTKGVVSTNASSIRNVYIEMQLGKVLRETREGKLDEQQCTVNFTDEVFVFPFNDGKEMFIHARDRRSVQKIIRGNPSVGAGSLPFPELDELKDMQERTAHVFLTRNGIFGGALELRYRLLQVSL